MTVRAVERSSLKTRLSRHWGVYWLNKYFKIHASAHLIILNTIIIYFISNDAVNTAIGYRFIIFFSCELYFADFASATTHASPYLLLCQPAFYRDAIVMQELYLKAIDAFRACNYVAAKKRKANKRYRQRKPSFQSFITCLWLISATA